MTTNVDLLDEYEKIVELFGGLQESDLPLDEEHTLKLAFALRTIGGNYGTVSLLKIAQEYSLKHPMDDISHFKVDLQKLHEIMDRHRNLNHIINLSNLRDIHLLKPIVDGKVIQTIYGCGGGKHIKSIMDECVRFQILNLDAPRDQVEEYMMSKKDEFMSKYA